MLAPSLALLLLGRGPGTSQEVYDALQARLKPVKAIRITRTPTTGNSWDREVDYTYLRPNMRRVAGGYGFTYITDGKRLVSSEEKGGARKLKPLDWKRFYLPGFESFFPEAPPVTGRGLAHIETVENQACTVIELDEGAYIDKIWLGQNGLPLMASFDRQTPVRYDVELNTKVSKDKFRPVLDK